MDLYARMFRQAYRWRAGAVGAALFAELAKMQALERRSLDELVHLQTVQLRDLLSHAYRHVPFWRQQLEAAGMAPEALRSPEDLRALPFMTKDLVRSRGPALVARTDAHGPIAANATGGSTGEPMHFWQDQAYKIISQAAKLRYRGWHGYELGERIAYLWGARRDTSLKGVRSWLRRQARQEIWISAFDLDQATMLRLRRLLGDWKPKLLVAYPSALQAFARFVRQTGLPVRPPPAVECSAEKLWPEQRQEIEAALQAPVFDAYGSREFGSLAVECPHRQGLHVFMDTHIIEVIRDGQPAAPGEVGEIVVTCLVNHAMPFIRYRTGDLGVLAERRCSCGRTLPLLADVIGRSNAVVSLPNGRLVHGAYFSYFFYHQGGVNRYRIQQPDRQSLAILLEGDDTLTPERLAGIAHALRTDLGADLQITVTRVAHIEPLPSGKLGYLVSEVPVNFAGPAVQPHLDPATQ